MLLVSNPGRQGHRMQNCEDRARTNDKFFYDHTPHLCSNHFLGDSASLIPNPTRISPQVLLI